MTFCVICPSFSTRLFGSFFLIDLQVGVGIFWSLTFCCPVTICKFVFMA
jgi:hypothetical protein